MTLCSREKGNASFLEVTLLDMTNKFTSITIDEKRGKMSNYIILSINDKNYIYDAYDNILKQIPNELCELIHKRKKTKKYFELLNRFDLRDVLDVKRLQITSPLIDETNKWKIENRQKHLVISLTEKCNMRCEYCGYISKYEREYDSTVISDSIMEKAIQQFITHSVGLEDIFISFYGGEPLLEQARIRQAVHFCEENHLGQNIHYCVTTNGICLKEDFVSFIVEHDFLLIVSLDGPKNIHDRYRKKVNGENTYDIIINNLKVLKKKYPKYFEKNVSFNAVVAPPYYFDVITDFFSGSKVNLMELKATEYFKRYLSENGEDANEKIPQYDGPMYDIMLAIKELKKFHLINRDSTHILLDPCGYCLPYCKRVFVNTKGELLICEKVDESCGKYVIGNVDEWIDYAKLNELLNNTVDTIQKNCQDCWAIRFCSTCFINEDEIVENGLYCNQMREKIKKQYEKYLELLDNQNELIALFDKFSVE